MFLKDSQALGLRFTYINDRGNQWDLLQSKCVREEEGEKVAGVRDIMMGNMFDHEIPYQPFFVSQHFPFQTALFSKKVIIKTFLPPA